MIHPRRHVLLPAAALAATAVLAVAAALLARATLRLSGESPSLPAVPAATLPEPARLAVPPNAKACIAPLGGKSAPDEAERFFAALQERFRLAGFRLRAKNPGASSAIIEDRESRQQWMRRVGEKLTASIAVSAVGTNSVTLSTPYGDCVLFLARRGGGGAPAATRPAAAGPAAFASGAVARLADAEEHPGTWRLDRSAVMAYYDEIKTRPERLEAVFDTLAPIWYTDEADGKQKIEGYRVEICGEEEFFKAIGFREGDVVREVNGIPMTNRYAAEELIRRFVNDDLSFAHIKMERDGEEIVQSYFVNPN